MSKIWECKIGEVEEGLLTGGSDWPMREAVKEAYKQLTGKEPDFCSSGWGAKLTEPQRKKVLEAFERISRDAGRAILFLDGADPCSPQERRLNDDRNTVHQALTEEPQRAVVEDREPTDYPETEEADKHYYQYQRLVGFVDFLQRLATKSSTVQEQRISDGCDALRRALTQRSIESGGEG